MQRVGARRLWWGGRRRRAQRVSGERCCPDHRERHPRGCQSRKAQIALAVGHFQKLRMLKRSPPEAVDSAIEARTEPGLRTAQVSSGNCNIWWNRSSRALVSYKEPTARRQHKGSLRCEGVPNADPCPSPLRRRQRHGHRLLPPLLSFSGRTRTPRTLRSETTVAVAPPAAVSCFTLWHPSVLSCPRYDGGRSPPTPPWRETHAPLPRRTNQGVQLGQSYPSLPPQHQRHLVHLRCQRGGLGGRHQRHLFGGGHQRHLFVGLDELGRVSVQCQQRWERV